MRAHACPLQNNKEKQQKAYGRVRERELSMCVSRKTDWINKVDWKSADKNIY